MTSNPCFDCGQCCQHFRVSFYHGEIEGNGVGIVPAELTTKLTDHLACMKGTEKGGAPCIALRHTKEEGWRCSIYENRPTPCREFNIFNDDLRIFLPVTFFTNVIFALLFLKNHQFVSLEVLDYFGFKFKSCVVATDMDSHADI